jgi:hypothetical protein
MSRIGRDLFGAAKRNVAFVRTIAVMIMAILPGYVLRGAILDVAAALRPARGHHELVFRSSGCLKLPSWYVGFLGLDVFGRGDCFRIVVKLMQKYEDVAPDST